MSQQPLKVLRIFQGMDVGERHHLLRTRARGIEVSMVCNPEAPFQEELQAAGIVIHHLRMHKRHDPDAVRQIRQWVLAEQPEIVHAYTKTALSNTIRAIQDLPPKLVAYRGIVGNLHWLNPSARKSFFHPRVDRITCVCEAIRQDLLHNRFLGWHLPEEKVVTVHKGHETDWWPRENIPADFSEFGIPTDAPVIGCVAQMRKRKGIPVLIEAFEKLATPDAHLLLIGKVNDKRIARRIARSPAANRIHLPGWRADAAALIGALDVFVLPSLRREGLPRVVIEAMSQQVPAVVTDSGGSPELIEDGISGRIVASGDANALSKAIDELLGDPERRRQMGIAAEERIRTCFNPDITVEKTLAVYSDLLGRDVTGGNA
ncbi:glycosyltransferase [Thiohalophilus sp.]|uniref:glycosyltransferase n=1 Tax=Thiohalophilus sp. TaxID=3028392 RepID=UPI0039759FDE